tara:strand:+ start:38 stop:1264 length:1227 start_codon:yes stop_codon:yes gene_type:complete
MMHLAGVIGITQVEAALLVGQQPGWWKDVFKLFLAYICDIPWRLRDKFHRRLATGCAGVARLRASLLDRDIPLWLNCPMKSVITQDGEVIGIEVEQDGELRKIEARKGVILAAGGFEHNQEMRDEYLPKPSDHRWSAGALENTGDAIVQGLRLGAKMHRLGEAWWCNTISVPGETIPRLSIMEKSYPGSIMVNPSGQRFSNESQNYMAFQQDTFLRHTDTNPCYPTWQIFDAKFRASYFVGPLYNSKFRPDWMIPSSYEKEGFFATAASVRQLAEKTNIDPDGLEKTVELMNQYAESGTDEQFGRGDSAYDRYYGDHRISPNPCLGPIDQPPFYAVRVDPGDFGTQGGMVTNCDAQVVRETGEIIPGLYAIGNCSAPTLPCYPGPGATLGPAMTFAYQAAKSISGYQD